jgi:hypothetical protein
MSYKFVVQLVCDRCDAEVMTTACVRCSCNAAPAGAMGVSLEVTPDLPTGWTRDDSHIYFWPADGTTHCSVCAALVKDGL